jgi:hypothetical protein
MAVTSSVGMPGYLPAFTEEMALLTVSTARISSIEGAVLLQQNHPSAGQADAFSFVVVQVSGRMMCLVQCWVQITTLVSKLCNGT